MSPRIRPAAKLPAALLAIGVAACSSGPMPPRQPAGRPPTPASVTRSEPGGDAADPHRAALARILAEPWGMRNDRDDQVASPLPDRSNWRRVRYWGFDHLAGFRYGKAHHAVGTVVVVDLPEGTPVKSETCMQKFDAWARPQMRGFDVRFGAFDTKLLRWRDQPLVAQKVDGWVSWGLGSTEFSAAWAAYPAYKNACLVFAVAVPWREQKELARAVRDRFVSEGFASLQAFSEEKAYRHPRPEPQPKANDGTPEAKGFLERLLKPPGAR